MFCIHTDIVVYIAEQPASIVYTYYIYIYILVRAHTHNIFGFIGIIKVIKNELK